MSPMGFAVHRQARYEEGGSLYDDDWDSYGDMPPRSRPVPIWLCVFLVISYIIAGAFLFARWERWEFLDSAYFCFITLTTIGKALLSSSRYPIFSIESLSLYTSIMQKNIYGNSSSYSKVLVILCQQRVLKPIRKCQ